MTEHTGVPLPHRFPFLLIDRVVEVRPRQGAVATRNVTWTEPLLDGRGCLPPALLAEAIAQTAGVAAVGDRPGTLAVLARIDRFRCSGVIRAGDRLQVSVHVVRIFGATVKARGVVRSNGRRCAAAEVVLQLVPGAGL